MKCKYAKCGKTLVRKAYNTGVESKLAFAERQYCDRACVALNREKTRREVFRQIKFCKSVACGKLLVMLEDEFISKFERRAFCTRVCYATHHKSNCKPGPPVKTPLSWDWADTFNFGSRV